MRTRCKDRLQKRRRFFRLASSVELLLPDAAGLYEEISTHHCYRPALLRSSTDPGIFFLRTAQATSAVAAYDQMTFYEA
ncbi:hypothetical protein [Phenylobacterium sp.]|uniref:hypothetical protein n=1 Tax=Phenylobacterium sp. TaxID=1871053 RepID=UPI0035AE1EB5